MSYGARIDHIKDFIQSVFAASFHYYSKDDEGEYIEVNDLYLAVLIDSLNKTREREESLKRLIQERVR